MPIDREFHFFDPTGDIRISRGNLPHWYQPGATYFVTFRTEDSVPSPLSQLWYTERSQWLQQHGIDMRSVSWKQQLRSSPELERDYHQRFSRRFMDYLDRGLGACVLREQRFAQIVAESLTHFDGDRYHLADFVIMPNHVHVLVGLLGETTMTGQCMSWKRYSAQRINQLLGTKGRFWQEESFDHLVRSPEQFEYLQRYIAENPAKAGLQPGNYWLRRLEFAE